MQHGVNLADYEGGSTEPWTSSLIASLAQSMRAKRVLELGAYEGRTTVWLAEAVASHGGPVDAVEMDAARCIEARTRLSIANLTNATVHHTDAETFLRTIVDDYDFVFIDDDHTYYHVARELTLLMPHLAPGAVVCLHDVLGAFNLAPLVRQYDGIILNLPLLHAAGGLGVISLPGPLRRPDGAHVRIDKSPAAP